MSKHKKIALAAALFLALTLGAFTGAGMPATSHGGGVPVAHADGCDGNPPPPSLDCPPTPTPPPPGH